MSIASTQIPDSLSWRNRLNPFIFSATTNIVFNLYIGPTNNHTLLFSGQYTPNFAGEVMVDVCDVVSENLKTEYPSSNSASQNYWLRIFSWSATDGSTTLTGDFSVCNAKSKTNTAIATWLASNFLTDQPMEKQIFKYSPEWLSYYDNLGNYVLKARFYYKAGGHVDITLRIDTEIGCYTVNVSYYRIIRNVATLPSALLGYYDLLLFSGDTIIAKQRYLYREKAGRERYFTFVNPLGGIDTLTTTGANSIKAEATFNISRFGNSYAQLNDTEDRVIWSQSIGYYPWKLRNWIQALMIEKQGAWIIEQEQKTNQAIVITDLSLEASDNSYLDDATFSYMLEDVDNTIADQQRSSYVFSESGAEHGEDLGDDTTSQTLEIDNVTHLTETIAIPSTALFVEWTMQAVSSATPIYYYVNGSETPTGTITPGTTTSPLTIVIANGDTIQFSTENESVESIRISYYEVQVV